MPSVAEIVREKILGALSAGTIPWVKPWDSVGVAYNIISGKDYRGINAWLLPEGGYVTFKQAQALGAKCLPNTGRICTFYAQVKRKDAVDDDDTFGLLRYYTVFNEKDVEGLPAAKLRKVEVREFTPDSALEAFVAKLGAEIVYGGSVASHTPSSGRINMPKPETFHSREDFYLTLFHELCHWTRTERSGSTLLRKLTYAEEEIVAEVGSRMLAAQLGLDCKIENAQAYCQGWGSKLAECNVLKAASMAGKVADWLYQKGSTSA